MNNSLTKKTKNGSPMSGLWHTVKREKWR